MIEEVLENMAKFQRRGSNWRFEEILKLEPHLVDFVPLKGNSWIPLPEKIAKKKAVINMKNEDDKCFKWCVTRVLNPVDKNAERISGKKDKHTGLVIPQFKYFKNLNHFMKLPFIIYADFEAFLENMDSCEPNNRSSFTEKYQKHKPCGFCYKIVCLEEIFLPESLLKPVLYRAKSEDEDVAQIFVDKLEKDIYIYQFFKKPKKMIYTRANNDKFMKSKVCWLCEGGFSKNDEKVRDQCHFTGKFRGAAHSICNLKFKKPKFTPVFFHNLSGYDSHLFVKNLGKSEGNIDCISNNEEKYISFSKNIQVGTYLDKDKNEKNHS